jgi:protease I
LRVLIPVPSYGFDPTEASVPWKYIKEAGFAVTFATPDGAVGQADVRMATGKDLGILKSMLMNDKNGVQAYRELCESSEFKNPISYADMRSENFDALMLPGGHDKGMKEYLSSKIVQKIISEFFASDKPVAAICHGTLVVGRSSSVNGRSVLWGRKTTGLTRNQELIAYNLTRIYLGDYYRTYPELDTKAGKVTMADELKSYLKDPLDFKPGPGFPIPSRRDTPQDLSAGFTVLDKNYLSARWPGDAHKFGSDFVKLLKAYSQVT